MRIRAGLVGREAEIAQFEGLLTDPDQHALVVRGEAGVGKTAVIDAGCAFAEADGWRVVRALGVEAEEPFALSGLNQIVCGMRAFVADVDARNLDTLQAVLDGDSASEVAVLPLVMAVLNLLTAAARTEPLLLVIDDIQWLDVVSAEVLGAVGRRLSHPSVRIVAGQRVPSNFGFDSAGWTDMVIGALSAEDSERILTESGVALTTAQKATILSAAAGNPLALSELPRCADQIAGDDGLPLTQRLVDVFGGRLRQLEPDVRAELLRAALDGSAEANRARYVMSDVGPAVDSGLLITDALGTFTFRHPLVRAAVIHQASPLERRDAHRDLAELYSDVMMRRATHLAAAATGPDPEVAELLAKAARVSVLRGGMSAAVRWLRTAAELSTDAHRSAELFAEAAFVAVRAGLMDEAQDLAESTETGQSASAASVMAAAYQAFHVDGDAISTHARIRDALARPDSIDDRTLNRLTQLLLAITHCAGTTTQWQLTNQALLPVQDRIVPVILTNRVGVAGIADTASAIRSLLSERSWVGDYDRLPLLEARHVMLLAFPAFCIDAMDELRGTLRQIYAQLSEHGASIDAIEAGRMVMRDLTATGHWEHAMETGSACLAMAEQNQGSELLRHQLLAELAVLAADTGDFATAREYGARVTAWAKPRELNLILAVAGRAAARIALAENDFETAYRAIAEISPPGQFPSHIIRVGDSMLDLIESATQTGRLDEARTHLESAVRLRLDEVSPRVAALMIAVAAMTASDEQADELFRSALSHPGLADFPFERGRIQLAQGMWLRRQLSRTKARDALESAADGFDRLGAHPWAQRARAELRATGAPVRRREGELPSLSAQQRRIADLAAVGYSTKDIATQLSLSPRTVDAHLYRAFRILGVSRRSALGAALHQHDQQVASR